MADYSDLQFVPAPASTPHDDLGFVASPQQPAPPDTYAAHFKRFISGDKNTPEMFPDRFPGNVLNYPFQGLNQAAHGAGEVAAGRPVAGANDVLGGGFKAASVMAPEALPYLLTPAGALTGVASVAGGYAGGAAAGAGVRAMGGSPEAQGVGEKLGSLAGGAGLSALLSRMVPGLLSSGAQRLYQSALKPAPSTGAEGIRQAVSTGMKEGIPVSEKGVGLLGSRIDDLNQQIKAKVAESPFEVDPVRVASRVDQLRPTFASQVNPESDLAALDRTKAEYLRQHTIQAPFTKVAPGLEDQFGFLVPTGQASTPILQSVPATQAQAEKIGTYKQLRGKYGELSSADVEAQKALARGNKEELAANIPAIGALNARDSNLYQLSDLLERSIARNGNSAMVPIGDTKIALAKKLLDNPWLKSTAAIQTNRLGGLLSDPARQVPYWVPGLLSATVAR